MPDSSAERLKLVSETAAQLLSTEHPHELLESLFARLAGHLGLEIYFHFRLAEDGTHLSLAACGGMPEEATAGLGRLELGQAVCGTVALEGRPIVVEEVQWSDSPLTGLIRCLGITAYACHPLVASGKLLGTLSFGTRTRSRFAADEIELLATVCDLIAAAVDRGRLVAELRERRREAEEARAAAEAASRAKDEFLAALSHELRTPLAPVLLSVEAIERDPRLQELRAPLADDLARIRRNVQLEARLIDDLLDLTRISRGKLELHPEAVDLHALLRHTVEDVAPAGGRRPAVVLDLAAIRSRVWGDPARLAQIFWNLLANAVKFTVPEGTVTVRTADACGRVEVRIVDDGIGIEPGLLPHVFDAFAQGGVWITRRYGGLGLGLAIAKALVELHGGTIAAASGGPGLGATFTVALAAVDGDTGRAAEPLPAGEPVARLFILVVEDHADTAEVMAELLRLCGHRVVVAGSVEAARAAAAERDGGFDLVISDLGLPDGSGLELMRELAHRYGLRGIALSGYGMDEDVKRSLDAGFVRHLTKPVDLRALAAAIREAVGQGPDALPDA